jgi:hypothetical protein
VPYLLTLRAAFTIILLTLLQPTQRSEAKVAEDIGYIDTGQHLNFLITSTPMGIFARSLFTFQPSARRIAMHELPVQGSGWVALFNRGFELDEELLVLVSTPKFETWIGEVDFRQRVDELVKAMVEPNSEWETAESEREFYEKVKLTDSATIKGCMSNSLEKVCTDLYDVFDSWQKKFNDPYRVNIQHEYLSPEVLNVEQRKELESWFTNILEFIRLDLEKHSTGTESGHLTPAIVRIVPEEMVIQANPKKGVLEISETILRGIIFRAFYQSSKYFLDERNEIYDEAAQSIEKLLKIPANEYSLNPARNNKKTFAHYQTQNFQEASFSVRSLSDDGAIYSRSFAHYLELLSSLPSLQVPHISATWLRGEMLALGTAISGDEWPDYLLKLESAAETHDNAGQVMTEVELKNISITLSKQHPQKAINARIERYLELIVQTNQSIKETPTLFDVEFKIHQALMNEAILLHAQIDKELLKSAFFILAHESWHLWYSDDAKTPSEHKDEEFKADAHGMRFYLERFQLIESQAWLGTNMQSDFTGGNYPPAILAGRSPEDILEDSYRGTKCFNGCFYHPPMTLRLEKLRKQIDVGTKRQKDTEKQLICLSELIEIGLPPPELANACSCMAKLQDDDIDSLAALKTLAELTPACSPM